MIPHLLDIPSPPRGVWELGPLPIRAYALFIIVGIIVATVWGGRRFVARGGRPGRITDLAVWMVPFGLVGGRLYHVITDNELYFRPGKNPWNAFAIWDGGLGIWGAIALGGVGAWLGCRHYRIPLRVVADSLAPGIVLAQGIGRMGNYFNQELFGSQTTLPWGLDVFLRTPGGVAGTAAQCGTGEFPTAWIKADPTVLCGTFHPTFLYELLWDVGVAVFVVWADRRFRLGGGRVFWLYVAGYTLGRGWIEMLRIDTANHFLGLRINVFTSAIMLLVAVVFLVVLRKRQREDPELVWGIGPGELQRPRGIGTGNDGHDADPDSGGSEGTDAGFAATDAGGSDVINTDEAPSHDGGFDRDEPEAVPAQAVREGAEPEGSSSAALSNTGPSNSTSSNTTSSNTISSNSAPSNTAPSNTTDGRHTAP